MANINDLYSHFNELILQNTDSILSEMITYGNNQSVTIEDVLKLTVTSSHEEDENNGYIMICDNDSFGYPIIATDNECDVDWGDGSPVQHYTDLTDDYFTMQHDYSEDGEFTITITGEILSVGNLMCNAETIVIPSTVTTLPNLYVDELTEITFVSSTPPTAPENWSNRIEYQANDLHTRNINFVIRVPSGSLSAYQNAPNYPTQNVTYIEY